MGDLIANFSLPWYFYFGFGVIITLLLVHRGFRNEVDALLARMLGMKPRRQPKLEDDEE